MATKPSQIHGTEIDVDDSENIETNPTNNPSLRDIVATGLSRRNILKGSLTAAAAGYLAPAPAFAGYSSSGGSLLGFAPLTIETATAAEGRMVTVSPDYEYQILIPWGSRIDPNSGVREYNGEPDRRPTSAEQEQLIGIGHDGMFFYPKFLPRVIEAELKQGRTLPKFRRLLQEDDGMLCVNHEFGTNPHVLGKPFPESLEDVRISQAAHGVSVVRVEKEGNNPWKVRSDKNSRRVTVNTPMDVSGPAAGSPLLDNPAGNPVLGTVNNCGSGRTPWGTYVTCEENFNGYFGSTDLSVDPSSSVGFDDLQDTAYRRYGFSSNGFGYGWHVFDERFDIANAGYRNESNRFGWCVEIDPFDGSKKPVKRTAMGRFKHEAVAVKELDDGRVAVYMGDDQRGDYCYKFESELPWREAISQDKSPLDEGKLYVAVFASDLNLGIGTGKGVGEWVELNYKDSRIAEAGLDTQDKVVTYARLAADAVGATKMDRPEWTTIGTKGEVFWTLTNNNRKDQLAVKDGEIEVNEANPIFDHTDGHIMRTQDCSPTVFIWDIFIICRNTRPEDPGTGPFLLDDAGNFELDENGETIRIDYEFADYEPPADGGANTFTDPDAAWADPFGRLFIGTDGGQPSGLQDQLVVFDVKTGEYRRLLMGVNSDEITGITTTPDYRTMFTNTQHPGNGDPTSTNFPAPFDGVTIPRDCTIVLTRKDGGIVGS
ncbi:MAG: PhoX family phosphatase [Pseudomonadota bacterium]